jgi:hypothetical protein
MEQLEDIFKTDDFKKLPCLKRVWIRLQIAFIQTIKMM